MIFRNIIIACFFVFFLSVQAIAHEAKRDECIICGMWIDQYMKTRHVVVLNDGQSHSFCSFACAARYYNEHKDKIKEIKASDFLTEKLIDAKKAYYLEGSSVPGVMSYVSRIAFEKKDDAERFRKKKGGDIIDFNQALKNQLEGR